MVRIAGRFAGWGTSALAICALLLVAACSGDKEPKLLNLRSGQGPDEFSILPTKPLQAPKDFASLPPPTPGGSNLTDPTPEADAVAALGGNPAALRRPATSADNGILNYAGRFGVQAGIRAELAAADLEYRRRNDGRLLERLFNVNVYFKAYRPYALDQYLELARLRRAGVKTAAAPPDPAR